MVERNSSAANLVYTKASPATGGPVTSLLRPATLVLAFLVVSPSPVTTQTRDPVRPGSELDAFMEKVLAQREVNRQTLKQYILDEAEEFEVLGPGRRPLYRTRREFTWYLREGIHVRSPVQFDGVNVAEDERDRYEQKWLSRERSRQEQRTKKKQEREVTIGPQGVEVVSPGIPAEPRFVSEAYFMDFKFEPGNYYLAGREKIEEKEVLKVEYYPTRMFGDDDNSKEKEERDDNKGRQRETHAKAEEFERNIERRMNKTALITLWVDPAEHQIVKYTFDNVWLDFLPAGWLVRVDEMHASMTMGQPFSGIWLPRHVNVQAGVTLANGSYEAGYARTSPNIARRTSSRASGCRRRGFSTTGSFRRALHRLVLHPVVLHEGLSTSGSSRQVLHGRSRSAKRLAKSASMATPT
jgi:hypothetical protein